MNSPEIRIKTSKVFRQISQSNKRIIVLEGSARSSKTFSIIQWIILQHLQNPGLRTTISRLKLTWAKSSVMVDFLEILKMFQVWNPDDWNKSESIYKLNGGEISFIGLDEAQKVHGRKQDIFWVNEAVESEHESVRQLLIRTTRCGILDYNPSFETHWIYDKVIPRDDCTYIHSTFKDNPFLSKEIKDEILRLEPTPENIAQGTADLTSWKIYGLGERAAHRGLIMAKVKICKELPPQSEWKRCFYGFDFGFTNDPSTLSQIVQAHGDLYMRQLIYKRGLTNIINTQNPNQPSIQQYLLDLGIPKSARIWADSAEPKSIADLYNCGWYNFKAAEKGPDSIKAGIDTMLRYNIFLTEDSLDAIKEKNNYKWKEDKSGNPTNEPVDAFNHFWDGARYACYMELRRPESIRRPLSGHSGVVHQR